MYVLILFDLIDEFLYRLAFFVGELLCVVRNTYELAGLNLEAVVLKVLLHAGILVEVRVDNNRVLFLVHIQFFYAEINEFEFQFVEINTIFTRYGKASLAVKEELQTALCTKVSAVFGEVRTDISDSTHVVVGSGLNEDSDTVRAVTFVVDLLVAFGRLIGSFLNGAIDIVLRHVLAFALLNEHAQPRVTIRIGSAFASSNSDFFTQFSERAGHMSPTFQFSSFSVFKSASHNFIVLVVVD